MANRWDPITGQYLRPDGAVVPAEELRAALQTIVEDSADRLQIIAERLRDGRLDILGWREAVRTELRTSYGTAASLASGGVGQMGPSERGVLSGLLRQQYGFNDLMALDISQGRLDLTSDAFLARARMYAGGAHGTFIRFEQRGAASRGQRFERNVLEGGATHCGGCTGETGRGWVPLGQLAPVGGRDCLSQCRCHLIYAVEVPVEEAA